MRKLKTYLFLSVFAMASSTFTACSHDDDADEHSRTAVAYEDDDPMTTLREHIATANESLVNDLNGDNFAKFNTALGRLLNLTMFDSELHAALVEKITERMAKEQGFPGDPSGGMLPPDSTMTPPDGTAPPDSTQAPPEMPDSTQFDKPDSLNAGKTYSFPCVHYTYNSATHAWEGEEDSTYQDIILTYTDDAGVEVVVNIVPLTMDRVRIPQTLFNALFPTIDKDSVNIEVHKNYQIKVNYGGEQILVGDVDHRRGMNATGDNVYRDSTYITMQTGDYKFTYTKEAHDTDASVDLKLTKGSKEEITCGFNIPLTSYYDDRLGLELDNFVLDFFDVIQVKGTITSGADFVTNYYAAKKVQDSLSVASFTSAMNAVSELYLYYDNDDTQIGQLQMQSRRIGSSNYYPLPCVKFAGYDEYRSIAHSLTLDDIGDFYDFWRTLDRTVILDFIAEVMKRV